MKYNVGDKVRIKGLDWYNKNKTVHGDVWFDNAVFVGGQSLYCGCELTICLVADDSYHVIENDYYWTDEMIEGLVEEEINPEPKFKVGDFLFYLGETSGFLKVEEIREENGEIRYYETSRNLYLVENDPNVFVEKVCSVETKETKNNNDMEEKETLLGWVKESDSLRLVPHKDYEIKHDGDNFYLVKKKKEYPKTYEECCEIIHSDPKFYVDTHLYSSTLETLYKLLICRDAYWKIAGEEMGLGKPWKPDCNSGYFIPSIIYRSGFIQKVEVQYRNAILSFPTPEMRDAFYENFKKEIEKCKELL